MQCLLLLIVGEQELGKDSIHLCQWVVQGQITTDPPGSGGSLGSSTEPAPNQGKGACGGQAGAAPRAVIRRGVDCAALGLFLCSWHSSPHMPRVVPGPCWPAALGQTGKRSPEVPMLGAVKLVAGGC